VSPHAPIDLWLATAGAVTLVVGFVVFFLFRSWPQRRIALVALGGWLGLDIALGAFGLFAAASGRTIPGIVAGIFVPFIAGLWLLGRTRGVDQFPPLARLIGCQVYRVAGAVFLLAWARGLLPGAFALPAGIGDLCVGASAPFVASRVNLQREGWHKSAVVWNVAGLTDLVVAVTLGALTSPSSFHPGALGSPGYLTSRLPLVLVPVFAVPLSALLHVVTFRRLRATSERSAEDASPTSVNSRREARGAIRTPDLRFRRATVDRCRAP
jgi:hypothetical protein